MPLARPYTFPHGDLTNINIMVVEVSVSQVFMIGKRLAIFPVWWEYVCTSGTDSRRIGNYSAARKVLARLLVSLPGSHA
ncbi:uncharacterized protein BDW43DRAFT_286458 [Aspergillus alliaceus]|uniref:uncharacterized protein n=1 Tax=Petromyces alliaceus TaxID=209559 RepID=UPI0012A68D03|nr:uncharacterized protein BDW43DRAFT_286458 [Aspergillus alliaceus]KAB8230195.1 hypothetical protein BDW43DRAFT_286458 [Aspergillus alliaceus]